LEIGCGDGGLLASLSPSLGVGIDFSAEMVSRARAKYPHLCFYNQDAHDFQIEQKDFDYIILSDILNDVWDVQTVFENLSAYSSNHTRILLNSYSRLWEAPLSITEKLGLAKPVLDQNWLTVEDINNLLGLSGFELIRSWQEMISPLKIPLLASLLNHFLVRFWPLSELALTNFILARKLPVSPSPSKPPSVSIIIPARNEAGNIRNIFDSIPKFDSSPELIFVEGHSKDHTYEEIEQAILQHPAFRCKLLRQSGIGKGNAVREGIEVASGDIVMILDADLTVPPAYLPRFYKAICDGTGEFINGVRLIYPHEKESMQFLNLVGNKLFSLLFTWILGQSIKDTLCGTKVFWRSDYLRIAENRFFFGDFDPFGDFDLLLGAAKLGITIIDMPVRYQERTYGKTNIQRWKHGALLLRMSLFAIRKLKFY